MRSVERVSPPSDAFPEELIELCKSIGHETVEKSEVGPELSAWKRSRVISYGKALGFLQETSDRRLQLSEIGLLVLEGKTDDAFYQGIMEYELYRDLLKRIRNEVVHKGAVGISSTFINNFIEDDYGKLDVERSTIRKITKTFLATCEQASLGTYHRSRNPSMLEIKKSKISRIGLDDEKEASSKKSVAEKLGEKFDIEVRYTLEDDKIVVPTTGLSKSDTRKLLNAIKKEVQEYKS